VLYNNWRNHLFTYCDHYWQKSGQTCSDML